MSKITANLTLHFSHLLLVFSDWAGGVGERPRLDLNHGDRTPDREKCTTLSSEWLNRYQETEKERTNAYFQALKEDHN